MFFPVLELAKYIVVKCINNEHPISNLQLQKILFYVQREFLHSLNRPAFIESIEAWPFGPVVPDVYYYFCGAGAMRIGVCSTPDDTILSMSENERRIIDSIIESKRTLNPWDMVAETHKQGGAWDSVYNGGYGNREIIPISDIGRLDFQFE